MPNSEGTQAIRLDEIARFVGGQILGSADTLVSGVSSLDLAGPGDLTYVAAERFRESAWSCHAAAFIVGQAIDQLRAPQIIVENPAYAFALTVQKFFVRPLSSKGIADQVIQGEEVMIGPDVTIWPFVTLGNRVKLGARVTMFPGVFIGDDCVVGEDTVLYPNVTVREGCIIGCRVVIHSGTVVGSDGFGYVQYQGRHQKVPQIGTVTIEDDVELGANVTVDRATFGRTVVKRGTKVDNLVQIAHNVTVGEHSILVAQVGIAGSTTLGRHVIVGGQAGLVDHLTIGDQARIAARSGVAGDLEAKQTVSGTPAIPHEVWLRSQAIIPRLPEIRRKVRELEARIQKLESQVDAYKARKKTRKR